MVQTKQMHTQPNPQAAILSAGFSDFLKAFTINIPHGV